MDIKKITYQIDIDSTAPVVGQYLVTLGKRGGSRPSLPSLTVLSVMIIKTVRKINHRSVFHYQGYALELYNRPDLKPFTEFEGQADEVLVWVRGQEALPCFWIPRGQSKPDVCANQ